MPPPVAPMPPMAQLLPGGAGATGTASTGAGATATGIQQQQQQQQQRNSLQSSNVRLISPMLINAAAAAAANNQQQVIYTKNVNYIFLMVRRTRVRVIY